MPPGFVRNSSGATMLLRQSVQVSMQLRIEIVFHDPALEYRTSSIEQVSEKHLLRLAGVKDDRTAADTFCHDADASSSCLRPAGVRSQNSARRLLSDIPHVA